MIFSNPPGVSVIYSALAASAVKILENRDSGFIQNGARQNSTLACFHWIDCKCRIHCRFVSEVLNSSCEKCTSLQMTKLVMSIPHSELTLVIQSCDSFRTRGVPNFRTCRGPNVVASHKCTNASQGLKILKM